MSVGCCRYSLRRARPPCSTCPRWRWCRADSRPRLALRCGWRASELNQPGWRLKGVCSIWLGWYEGRARPSPPRRLGGLPGVNTTYRAPDHASCGGRLMETLRDLFEHVLRTIPPDRPLMRARTRGRWMTLTTAQFASQTRQTAARLAGAGVNAGDRVALFSENRPQWHIIDFACHLLGAVPVPLYPTLPAKQVQYIVADSGAKVLVVSGKERARTAVQAAAATPGVRVIGIDPDLADGVPGLDSLALPPQAPAAPPLTDTDLASLIYTSGTMGGPKGVMLSHRNFTSQINALRPLYPIFSTDEVISFLPLSHIYARILDYLFLYCGCQITYVSPPEKVVEYIAEVRPTIMGSFPGLYEKAYVRILSRLQQEGGLKARLFAWAMRVGRKARTAVWMDRRPGILTRLEDALAKKLVFSQGLERVGGRREVNVSR